MVTLREYQLESVKRASVQNLLIADDCGLGKTVTSIEAAAANFPYKRHAFRILVVCPKKIREQWVDQIAMQHPDHTIYIIGQSAVNLSDAWGWFIIHYDVLDKAAYLVGPVFDVVIADEAHRLRNRNNKWTKAIKRIVAGRYIALTATPMDKYPSEYWSILDFLQARGISRYHGFQAMYEDWDKRGPFPKYKGTKNLEDLQHLLRGYVVRHTKAEVAPELPPHIIVPTNVAMSEPQTELFEKIDDADDIIVDMGEELTPLIIANILAKLVRLQQMGTDPDILGYLARSGKLDWLEEFLDDHINQKVAIFTKFRHTADKLARLYDAAIAMGGRMERLDEFRTGKLNVLVGTIAGMGEGLDLPMATYSVFVDMEWSTLKMQQAYDRIHRMNITEPKITYLLLSNRVDALIYKAVQDKWNEKELILAFLRRTP